MRLVRICTNCGHRGKIRNFGSGSKVTPVAVCPKCRKRTWVYRIA